MGQEPARCLRGCKGVIPGPQGHRAESSEPHGGRGAWTQPRLGLSIPEAGEERAPARPSGGASGAGDKWSALSFRCPDRRQQPQAHRPPHRGAPWWPLQHHQPRLTADARERRILGSRPFLSPSVFSRPIVLSGTDGGTSGTMLFPFHLGGSGTSVVCLLGNPMPPVRVRAASGPERGVLATPVAQLLASSRAAPSAPESRAP